MEDMTESKLSLRVPPDMMQAIEDVSSKKNYLSVSEYVRSVIRADLEHHGY